MMLFYLSYIVISMIQVRCVCVCSFISPITFFSLSILFLFIKGHIFRTYKMAMEHLFGCLTLEYTIFSMDLKVFRGFVTFSLPNGKVFANEMRRAISEVFVHKWNIFG